MSKALRSVAFATAACALVASPAIAEDDADTEAVELTKGEQRLAKLLEGRVAGEPQTCLRTLRTDMQIIDETAIVYRQGRTLWVNVPRNAEQLDDRDALVTRQFDSRLCRTDIVTTIDSHAGYYTGNVFLGDFVPYRRVDS